MVRLERGMARSFEKKTCPRCGQQLYADMTVCYGCLYDFTRKDNGPSELAPVVKAPIGKRPLAGEPAPLPEQVVPPAPEAPRANSDDEATTVLDAPAPDKAAHAVCVRTPSAEVLVPLDAQGLSVGRGSGNRVVLREKSVSRRHLRVLPAEGGAEVRDLGSTNPARYRGRPLRGSVVVPWGEEVELGGVVLAMCE